MLKMRKGASEEVGPVGEHVESIFEGALCWSFGYGRATGGPERFQYHIDRSQFPDPSVDGVPDLVDLRRHACPPPGLVEDAVADGDHVDVHQSEIVPVMLPECS